jgi:hypothetical protein
MQPQVAEARAPFAAILLKEADATLQLSHSDICKSISDALSDMFPGQYCYVRDVFGDDESGDLIYCCGSDTFKASYEIGLANGKRTTTIDTDNQVNVLPRTVYDEEADEQDHYAGMDATDADEARKMPDWMRRMVYSERFIPKAERDAADSGDFAGKGRSFPILKPADVMAAVRSMGRAGSDNKSSDSLKSSIIRIAKKKGWTKYLPKAWQGSSSSEAVKPAADGTLKLYESAATFEAIVLKEAKADYEIKLIAPGKGSSAFYPKEVLQRDGPKVFKAGTHVYLNHPTAAEEASRPEGDVKNLAGVLTTTASFSETHAKGPGLYARMKVFADHGQMVEEKAAHVGMSIRASGIAESGKTKEGLPVLKELTSAESVDVVTHAGAGGMILQESAATAAVTTPVQEADTMTAEEAKKLIEAGIAEAVKPFRERAVKSDAREEATRLLESVTLPDKAKSRIIERACSALPLKDGELNLDEFRKLLVAEAKSEGEYLASITGSGRIVGMGPTVVTEADEKTARKAEKRALKEAKRLKSEGRDVFEALGMPKDAAKLAAREVA